MAFYSGTDGVVIIDGVKAAKVRNWTVTSNLGLLDTTSLGDTDATARAGIRTTTGSCQLFYYSDDPRGSTANSAAVLMRKLIKAHQDGTRPGEADDAEMATIRLKIEDGTSEGKYISGPAHLTSVGTACSVGEVVSIDVSFQFNGAPARVLL